MSIEIEFLHKGVHEQHSRLQHINKVGSSTELTKIIKYNSAGTSVLIASQSITFVIHIDQLIGDVLIKFEANYSS